MKYLFSEKLTDHGVLNLSRRLSKKEDIRELAISLDMADDQVDRHLNNNSNAINEAAHGLLTDWRKTQKDKRTAYSNLCDALQRAGMQLLINEL